jgi:hypothetical protein
MITGVHLYNSTSSVHQGVHQAYIKRTSILILFINTLYKYNNTEVNIKKNFDALPFKNFYFFY